MVVDDVKERINKRNNKNVIKNQLRERSDVTMVNMKWMDQITYHNLIFWGSCEYMIGLQR